MPSQRGDAQTWQRGDAQSSMVVQRFVLYVNIKSMLHEMALPHKVVA
jgi:hypothetical protein